MIAGSDVEAVSSLLEGYTADYLTSESAAPNRVERIADAMAKHKANAEIRKRAIRALQSLAERGDAKAKEALKKFDFQKN